VAEEAEERRAERRGQRQRQRVRARPHAGKDVAAVAVGAEQQQGRAAYVGRLSQASAHEPCDRHRMGSILLVALLELAEAVPRIDERRAPGAAGVGDTERRRRGVEQIGEPGVGIVRRNPRRKERGQCDSAERRRAERGNRPAGHSVVLIRGREGRVGRNVPAARIDPSRRSPPPGRYQRRAFQHRCRGRAR
jgi:hypothetical protein